MDRSTADPIDPAGAPHADLDGGRQALRAEQAEWEQVRSQVEASLADLERRLLEQAERLECPRGAEAFREALREQLALALEGRTAAESRLAELQAERDELIVALGSAESEAAEPNVGRAAPNDALVDPATEEALREALRERDRLVARVEELADEVRTLRDHPAGEGAAELDEVRAERDDLERRLEEASDRLLDIAGADGELARTRRARDTAQRELEATAARAGALEAEVAQGKAAIEAFTGERDSARERCSEWEAAAEAAERRAVAAETHAAALQKDLDAVASEAAAIQQRLAASVAERDAAVAESAALETRVTRADAAVEDSAARLAKADATLARNDAELAAARDAVTAADARAGAAADELNKSRRTHDDNVAALRRSRDRVAKLEAELSAWAANSAGGDANSAELAALRSERDALEARLKAAQDGLASLRSDQAAGAPGRDAELAELREKFDLAMADLGRHRDHAAALEAQLATRPSVGPDDSGALERLREERDELAQQLRDALLGAEPSEELEDLRARFEMAVDDLRRVKNENAELHDRLATHDGGPTVPQDGGWEAQKRRLLAALESEGEPRDEPRREERAQISGTIEITDAVVAEKDREIERLRGALAGERPHPTGDDAARAAIDSDSAVIAERERLAGLEVDLRDRLRAAELELSVERAKITRAQSELAEQQLELETLRAAIGVADDAARGVAPKRRWLDKLGLNGDAR